MRPASILLAAATTVLVAASSSSPASAQTAPAPSAAASSRPDLIVFITVDQMRPDYFERFFSQRTG
jgi:hypothetical protein